MFVFFVDLTKNPNGSHYEYSIYSRGGWIADTDLAQFKDSLCLTIKAIERRTASERCTVLELEILF